MVSLLPCLFVDSGALSTSKLYHEHDPEERLSLLLLSSRSETIKTGFCFRLCEYISDNVEAENSRKSHLCSYSLKYSYTL